MYHSVFDFHNVKNASRVVPPNRILVDPQLMVFTHLLAILTYQIIQQLIFWMVLISHCLTDSNSLQNFPNLQLSSFLHRAIFLSIISLVIVICHHQINWIIQVSLGHIFGSIWFTFQISGFSLNNNFKLGFFSLRFIPYSFVVHSPTRLECYHNTSGLSYCPS